MNRTKKLRFIAIPHRRKQPSSADVIYFGAEAFVNVDVESAKQFRLQGQRLANRDNVQANWGRVQDVASREYANAFQLADLSVEYINDWTNAFGDVLCFSHHSSYRSPDREVNLDEAAPEASRSQATVLEQLEGFVDQIEGSTAFVTLKSEHGEELYGEYPAEELLAKGIEERRRFRVQTIEKDGEVHVSIDAIPDRPVSAVEENAINRRIDELLADDQLDGDY